MVWFGLGWVDLGWLVGVFCFFCFFVSFLFLFVSSFVSLFLSCFCLFFLSSFACLFGGGVVAAGIRLTTPMLSQPRCYRSSWKPCVQRGLRVTALLPAAYF